MEPKFLRKGVERLEEKHSKYLRGGVEGIGTPCSGDGATPLIRLVALTEALPPSPLLSGRKRQCVYRRRTPQLIVNESQEFGSLVGPLGVPIIRKVSGPYSGSPLMVFSVTYYSELRYAITFYCRSHVLSTKVKLVVWTL